RAPRGRTDQRQADRTTAAPGSRARRRRVEPGLRPAPAGQPVPSRPPAAARALARRSGTGEVRPSSQRASGDEYATRSERIVVSDYTKRPSGKEVRSSERYRQGAADGRRGPHHVRGG